MWPVIAEHLGAVTTIMQSDRSDDSAETGQLLLLLERGDHAAVSRLLSRHNERLRLTIRLRMDRRLQGRFDPSDVLQETYLEATARLPDYLAQRDLPFFLWLRFLAVQQLLIHHRRHLATEMRDAGREVRIDTGAGAEASSAILAAELVGAATNPVEAAIKAELRDRVQWALEGLDPVDREVLALRHFEQLTNGEAARVLGLSASAASHRYARALLRLKEVLRPRSESDSGGAP
jgi:RNA polymerase sigma-70 factor, ECF subfamily